MIIMKNKDFLKLIEKVELGRKYQNLTQSECWELIDGLNLFVGKKNRRHSMDWLVKTKSGEEEIRIFDVFEASKYFLDLSDNIEYFNISPKVEVREEDLLKLREACEANSLEKFDNFFKTMIGDIDKINIEELIKKEKEKEKLNLEKSGKAQ